jgi:type II secretory pathway component PulC
MLKYKRIYIALALFFISVALTTIKINALPALGNRPQPVDVAESHKQDNDPWAMNLLMNPNKEPLFGSYQLKGVVILADAAHNSRRAIINDLTKGGTRTYFLNETLSDGSQLVDIEPQHVIFQNNGVRKRICIFNLMDEKTIKQRKYLANAPNGYMRLNNNEYVLNPYQVFRGDANLLLDFAIRTYKSSGVMEGLQLSEMGNNGLPMELGFQKNDVLLSLNQKPMDSILNAIKTCINAHKSDEIQLKVRRGDKTISLTYHLFWEGKGSWTPVDVINTKPISSFLSSIFSSPFSLKHPE